MKVLVAIPIITLGFLLTACGSGTCGSYCEVACNKSSICISVMANDVISECISECVRVSEQNAIAYGRDDGEMNALCIAEQEAIEAMTCEEFKNRFDEVEN